MDIVDGWLWLMGLICKVSGHHWFDWPDGRHRCIRCHKYDRPHTH